VGTLCKYENYLREFLGNYLREYLFALVRKAASEVCQALLLTQKFPQIVPKNSLIESTYLQEGSP
jgi:hypothetical protein